jgi:4-amino-4-deoxy-L-arabinose transferase-like glycosyltransferase
VDPAADGPYPPRVTRPLRLAALGAALFAGLCVLAGVLGPATSTETRYMESGREMFESGDWVVPRLNAAPLLEKPPLHYWVTAASIAAFGVNDVAPHVGSLLTGVLLVLVVAAIGRRFSPAGDSPETARARGRLTALALLTMPAFLVQAYVVAPDVQLVLTTTVAGWAWLEADRASGRARFLWTLAMWGALGLAMLVKGPLSLALVFGAAVATAIGRRSARVLRPFGNPAGIALFAAVALPWYLVADARLPGLLDALVSRRLFGSLQATSEGVGHPQPLYVTWAPVLGTAPWLAALPASIRAMRARSPWRQGPGLPFACLALGVLLMFTVTPNRLFSYASPAFPWIAVLAVAGAPLSDASPAGDAWRRWLGLGAIGCAVAALLIPTVLAILDDGHPVPSVAELASIAVPAGLAAGVVAPLARRGGCDPLPRAVAAAVLLTATIGIGATVVPYRIPANRGLWREVAARRVAGEELGMALPATGDWGLFPWYAREEVRFFDYDPKRNMLLRPEAYRPDLFVPFPRDAKKKRDPKPLREWFAGPGRRWLYLRVKDRRELLGDTPAFVVAQGGRSLVLTNLPLPEAAR